MQVYPKLKPLIIKAMRRGSRQFCRVDKYGFPRTAPKPRTKNFFGFKTGDMVKVIIPDNAKTKIPVGVYIGRIAVRSSGFFDVKTKDAKLAVSHKYCSKPLHLMDGYSYQQPRPDNEIKDMIACDKCTLTTEYCPQLTPGLERLYDSLDAYSKGVLQDRLDDMWIMYCIARYTDKEAIAHEGCTVDSNEG